jgi:hypothetical protein
MLHIFLIFGVLSFAALGIAAFAALFGVALCAKGHKTRPAGLFVMLVPCFSALAALTFSWGALLWADSQATASTDEWWERWQILAIWFWPIGFAAGALIGGLVGVALSVFVIRWLSARVASR